MIAPDADGKLFAEHRDLEGYSHHAGVHCPPVVDGSPLYSTRSVRPCLWTSART